MYFLTSKSAMTKLQQLLYRSGSDSISVTERQAKSDEYTYLRLLEPCGYGDYSHLHNSIGCPQQGFYISTFSRTIKEQICNDMD